MMVVERRHAEEAEKMGGSQTLPYEDEAALSQTG